MQIVKKAISLAELTAMAEKRFGDLVKAVVDVEEEVMAVDADLHADQEALLLASGSKQENLWGINFYPKIKGEKWLEFDSMINLRPSAGNLSQGVDNPEIQKKIKAIVKKLVRK